MEKDLDRSVKDVMSTPGVVGVVCSDPQGLCLCYEGRTHVQAAGVVASLAELASRLEPETCRNPVIVLESDATNVLLQTQARVTTAIYKSPKN